MKITKISVIALLGEPGEDYDVYCLPFEEQAAYTDIYPQYPKKRNHPETSPRRENGKNFILHHFLRIDTDEGIYGMAGPVGTEALVFYLLRCIRPILLGMDPMNNELLWNLMYYSAPHGRKGDYILALSLADIALWDLKARFKRQPLHKLLGKVQQPKMPAYVNALGYSHNPSDIERNVKKLHAQGYQAVKWGSMSGPAQGQGGITRMEKTLSAVRTAIGPDGGLMLDVWAGWDLEYTRRVMPLLKEVGLTWLEEPLSPDLIDEYAVLRTSSLVPIAFGEHEYTRWGYAMLLKNQVADVYMFDPIWCGGITETLKIMKLMTESKAKVSLHTMIPALGAHLTAIYPESSVIIAEYTPIVAEPLQYFFKNPCRPEEGYFYPPEAAGAGFDLDDSKIIKNYEVTSLSF
jgi:L-alanine-DL-glutamate epimerase-like enolase superfamily enzyme